MWEIGFTVEATSVMPDKLPKENYRIPTPKELQYVYNHYYLDILASSSNMRDSVIIVHSVSSFSIFKS